MFGRGRYNFMDNFKKGDWCFLGAEITFENGGPIYNYSNFINWLKTNYFMNGSNKVYYSDYLTVNYVTPDSITRIHREALNAFEEYQKDNGILSQNLANIMANMYIYYLDRSSQYINTNKKLYVVYRYSTVKMDFSEKLKRTLIASSVGFLGGMIVTGVVEGAVIGFLAGGVGAIPGAIVGGIKGVISGIKDIFEMGKAATKIYRFTRFTEDVADSVRFTGKTLDFLNAMKSSRVSFEYLDEVKDVDKFVESFSTLSKFGKSVEEGTYDVKELANVKQSLEQILNNEDEIDALYKILDKDSDFAKVYNSKSDFKNALEVLDEDLKSNKLSFADRNLLKKIAKGGVGLGGAVSAGRLEYLYNPHNIQYVTIMSPEEYYRICGG